MTTTTSPIRVGLVGLGRAGQLIHLPAFKADPNFVITAVADPDSARMEAVKAQTDCQTFSTVDELAWSGACDLVVIATPSHFHFQDAQAVIQAGVHCVLEKPMATQFADAKALLELARAKGIQLFVHHQHLFYDEYNYFREVIDRGVLGDIFQIRAFWGGYARRWDWQTLKKNGGGQLNNTCPHLISVILPLLGDAVINVSSSLLNVKDAGDAEDHVQLLLHTSTGKTADLVVTGACALPLPRWMILGSNGTLSSDGQTAKLRYYDPEEVQEIQSIDGAAPLDSSMSETLPWIEIEEPVKPSLPASTFVANIADVLLNGASPVVSPESALEVMRVLELSRTSAPQPSLIPTP